jgi:hypothetical protein
VLNAEIDELLYDVPDRFDGESCVVSSTATDTNGSTYKISRTLRKENQTFDYQVMLTMPADGENMETWEYHWDTEGIRPPEATYAKYHKSHRYDKFTYNDDRHEHSWLDSNDTEYSVATILAKYREIRKLPKRNAANLLVAEALREYIEETTLELED